MVLELHLPAAVALHKPACDKLIISGVELVFSKPPLVGELAFELGILEDVRLVDCGAAAEAGNATCVFAIDDDRISRLLGK